MDDFKVDAFRRVNAFIKEYKALDLPVLENAVGDSLIKPSFRRLMKRDFQAALMEDLNEVLVDAEVLLTSDGLVMVVQNDNEGFYCVQLDTKFKNLDYDPTLELLEGSEED